MTVAFDATFLLYLFAPAGQVGVPADENGVPVDFVKERTEALIADLDKAGTKIVVPTPALRGHAAISESGFLGRVSVDSLRCLHSIELVDDRYQLDSRAL